MSTIVLNALNYVGDGIANGISRFTERSAGVVAYFKQVTGSVSLAKSGRSTIKFKLVMPYPSAAPASCPCPGEAPFTETIADITVRIDGRADAAYRTAVRESIEDLVQSTPFINGVVDLTLTP